MNPPRRPIQARVRDSILQALRSGSIRPGQKLSVPALADALGVSVTPIREALISLAGDGVLDLLEGGVVIVPEMTRCHLEQWLWLRRVIESQLVARGLERKTPSDAAAIADLANGVALDAPDADLCTEMSSAVIDRIVALADHEVLVGNLRRVRSRCATALADGERHAGVEVAVSFISGVAKALRDGNDEVVRGIHGRYLDSIDAAALSIIGK